MLRAAAVVLVLLAAPVARAQGTCAPARTRRCPVLPAARDVPTTRPAHPSAPAAGTPSARAAAALDVAWTAHRALPEIGPAPEARGRVLRQLEAILAEHTYLDGLALGPRRPEWPTEYAVRYAVAELAWRLEDWDACARHFESFVTRYPDSSRREDAAYAALLCHNNRYRMEASRESVARLRRRRGRRGRRHREDEEPSYEPRPLNELQSSLARAADRFACIQTGTDDSVTAAYRAARMYYEANHFEEAASRFREIAERYPRNDMAEYAANLYLDSLNLLGRSRPECAAELSAATDRLRPVYCATERGRREHPDLCSVLDTLVCDVARRRAEALSRDGRHADARDGYLRIVRAQAFCGRLDELLYNAATEAEAAGDRAGASQIRATLRREHPQSEFAARP